MEALDEDARPRNMSTFDNTKRWGILFVPAYLSASVYLYFRGRDAYRDNPFEVEAYAADLLVEQQNDPSS